ITLPTIKHCHNTLLLGRFESSFVLSNFNEFINKYKTTHSLALEVKKAFD
ncbi:8595_t:CDS:1, partial [Funneliformis caledonium]